jgi:UDP-N-acetylmuramyl pentapeptide phosphotransferase/UDP-N-acetylglucosamine-1-phosphate transferase
MDKSWMLAIAVPLAVLGGSFALTALALEWLKRRAILDHPGERSSHEQPVPRGGGLAVVPILAAGWVALVALGDAPAQALPIALIACALAAFSFLDDVKGLPIFLRLACHFVAAAAAVWLLPYNATVFQDWLPWYLDRAAATLLLVWFINLYNFMDGIDGITGVETACIGLGAAWVLTLENGFGDGGAYLALTVLAAAVGFLPWNWHKAGIFLGDAGSVPLGLIVGWLMLLLASKGYWAPALILPLYYLADATITLARRIARGEKFWQAHKSHFYQRAASRDGDHAAVVAVILAGDMTLLALALLAVENPLAGLIPAVAVTAALLFVLARRGKTAI